MIRRFGRAAADAAADAEAAETMAERERRRESERERRRRRGCMGAMAERWERVDGVESAIWVARARRDKLASRSGTTEHRGAER
jgi:hypothetical protein